MPYSKSENQRVNKEILVAARRLGLRINFVLLEDKVVDLNER